MDSTLQNIRQMDKLEFANSINCDIQNVATLLHIKKDHFTLICQNIRSIYQNFDNLMISTSQLKFNPSVILLTECWLCDYKEIPTIPNYKTFSTTKHRNKSDGVVLYVRDNIIANVIEVFLQDASCLQLQVGEKTILAIYRSPSTTDTSGFISSLNDHLDKISSYSSVAVVGDININLIPRESEQMFERRNRNAYLEMLAGQNIMPGHCLPTRENNSLDHVMIRLNNTKSAAQIAVLNTSVTDHMMILLHLNTIPIVNNCKKTKLVTSYRDACDDLVNKNLAELLLCRDPELVVQGLITKIKLSIEENSKTVKIPKNKRVLKPWITPGIISLYTAQK